MAVVGTRLDAIPGFNIDRVAALAGDDPDVLRLENLDTDIPPPAEAVEATRAAIGTDDANSWLPFTGRNDLKEAVAEHPREDGRCFSTLPRWAWTAWTSPTACWNRRSPRRRCAAGEARSRIAMSASSSATSR